MATQFEIDCALMAGASYLSNRPDVNKFPVPEGWGTIGDSHFSDTSSGFEAVSFKSGDEIVISFAGTNSKDFFGDVAADVALGSGYWSTQLLQAAEYYMEIKKENPYAKITFTGHSLGGGLASLMGVFFDETAVTFDQAPFRNAANMLVAQAVKEDLTLKYSPATNPKIAEYLAPLDKFIWSFDPFGFRWSRDGLAARASNVTSYNVQGEFLSVLSLARIGTSIKLEHGTPTLTAIALTGDLHSQALLTAFLEDDKFVDSYASATEWRFAA
jgi:Lipase (class 3)